MLPVSNRGVGSLVATPDVCLTPPGVPIPYTNMAAHAAAATFSPNVFTAALPTLFQTTLIPMSTGDEAGVLHYSFIGPGIITTGLFPHVLINFLPVATLGAATSQNAANCTGTDAIPSVTNVFVCRAPHAAAPGPCGAPGLDDALSGTLAIHVFTLNLPARVAAAVTQLEAQARARGGELAGLCLDLRGCPGGELVAAIELASDFVPGGTLLGRSLDPASDDGDEEPIRARGTRAEARHRMALTLLVDAHTASAAELFTDWLAARGRARVVGGPTYGKRRGAMLSAPAFQPPALRYATYSSEDPA